MLGCRGGWHARVVIGPAANLVGLTTSGRRVMARVAQQAAQHVGLILSRLTAAERDDITRALARLSTCWPHQTISLFVV